MLHIFYHKPDCDGHCSGYLAQLYNQGKEDYTLTAYDYDMPFPEEVLQNLGQNDKAYFLDIVPKPYEILYELSLVKKNQIIVIDHHKTWIESGYASFFPGKSEIGKAGCELAWEYFFPTEPMPRFIKLLGRYDVWDKSDQTLWNEVILPFQYGMRLSSTHPKKRGDAIWDVLFYNSNPEDNNVDDIIRNGKICLQYQDKINRSIMNDYSFDATFSGYRALCVNANIRNSQLFESKWDSSKYDIMLAYTHKKGADFSVSIYTTPETGIDVSDIAKKYGGGGHKNASGLLLSYPQLKEALGI